MSISSRAVSVSGLGITINSTQNIFGVCELEYETLFKPFEQSLDACADPRRLSQRRLSPSYEPVTGLLISRSSPFYFIGCYDHSWETRSYGLTYVGGNYSTVTALGLTPMPDNYTMEVNHEGQKTNITSKCQHPTTRSEERTLTQTVMDNSWGPHTEACCILTWAPPTNYTNNIYLEAVDYIYFPKHVQLIAEPAVTPTNPNTTVPTNSSASNSNSNSSSSTSSSSSSSTGTSTQAPGSNSSFSSSSSSSSSPIDFTSTSNTNTNTNSNSNSNSNSTSTSTSTAPSNSSSSSSSTGNSNTGPGPVPVPVPVPSGASAPSITNPTQALVAIIGVIYTAFVAL